MKTFETDIQKVILNKDIHGNILDIGGGGEGVIGRLYKDKVTAIDNRQDELDDAPDGPIKMLMDAEKLDFSDNRFDSVTSFFTLMYIHEDKHLDVLREAYRVLKPKGKLYIWDTNIPKEENGFQVFILNLKIILPDEQITTGYGVGYREQDAEYFIDKLAEIGFKTINIEKTNQIFYLIAEK